MPGAGATGAWKLEGAEAASILATVHQPPVVGDGGPAGVVLVAHGFMGYKDYGFIPRLTEAVAAAGFVGIRFNFSHSGMTRDVETFAREDLFERNTVNKQVEDLRRLFTAVSENRVPGVVTSPATPVVVVGHSRGGTTAILLAGRHDEDARTASLAGVVTIAAPASGLGLSDDEVQMMLAEGFVERTSARTGQVLRLGIDAVMEHQADPEDHDPKIQAARMKVPLLVIHGDADPTIPLDDAAALIEAAKAAPVAANAPPTLVVLEGADHVLGEPNPRPADAPDGPALARCITETVAFAQRVCGSAGTG